ncbi:MAG TPA: hypothetical protein VHZ74_13975 [Bryobacteraceae bacterium]|nr:hypothetical protein [Bryobacteraceae bacterium]
MPKRIDLKGWLVVSSVTLLSVLTAWFGVFSGQNLGSYDDEGMLMIDIKRFFEGRALYDDVGTIYGPLYYFYEWCAHVLTGTALSHDSVRFVSMFFWVASAVLVFFVVYRTTGSILLAAACHFLAFRTLSFIANEPAHPEELCSALLAGVGLAAVAVSSRKILMPLLGALAAALALTKINMGVFAVLAIGLALLFAVRRGTARLVLLIPGCAAALIFPVLLMWGHRTDMWAQVFSAVTVLALTAAIIAVSQQEFKWNAGPSDFVTAGLGFVTALVVIGWFPLAHGSTVRGMIDLLILQPERSFAITWFLASPIPVAAIPWALAGVCCAWLAATKRIGAGAVDSMKVAFAAAVGVLILLGFHYRVMSFATPFLWLAAIPPRNSQRDSIGVFARSLLVFLSVVQILYAYPVAGYQVAFTSMMMIVPAAICLMDSLPVVLALAHQSNHAAARGRWVVLPAAALTVLYVFSLWITIQEYEAGEPLGLPGTSLMRIDHKDAELVRNLSARIDKSQCTMLASAPGLLSFNFLTGAPAPGLIHYSTWMSSLSDAVQEKTIVELSKESRPCVLYNQSLIDFWTHNADVSTRPLVRYMKENFAVVYAASGYELMEPSARTAARTAAAPLPK